MLAIVDTETSTLEPETGHVVEVAIAAYSLEHRALVRQYSTVVRAPGNEAEHVNGIPAALAQSDLAKPRDEAARAVTAVAAGCSLVLAHNADFDRKWMPELHDRTWVCTCNDVDWPGTRDSRSLVAIALAHGLGVSSAHRAGTDVDLLCRLLTRVAELGHDVGEMIATAQRKRLYVVADTRFDAARNAKAKSLGFRFNESDKTWRRKLLPEKVAEMPFAVREVA